jgi:hypothetical protein
VTRSPSIIAAVPCPRTGPADAKYGPRGHLRQTAPYPKLELKWILSAGPPRKAALVTWLRWVVGVRDLLGAKACRSLIMQRDAGRRVHGGVDCRDAARIARRALREPEDDIIPVCEVLITGMRDADIWMSEFFPPPCGPGITTAGLTRCPAGRSRQTDCHQFAAGDVEGLPTRIRTPFAAAPEGLRHCPAVGDGIAAPALSPRQRVSSDFVHRFRSGLADYFYRLPRVTHYSWTAGILLTCWNRRR